MEDSITIHKQKTTLLIKEMIEVKKIPIIKHISKGYIECSLLSSPYWHPDINCIPDYRRCLHCWRYWCSRCGSGLGGMMGKCNYEFCEIGRRNLLS